MKRCHAYSHSCPRQNLAANNVSLFLHPSSLPLNLFPLPLTAIHPQATATLADSVHRLYENQEHLRRDCETIDAYQEDLEADLANIEEKLEKELLGTTCSGAEWTGLNSFPHCFVRSVDIGFVFPFKVVP